MPHLLTQILTVELILMGLFVMMGFILKNHKPIVFQNIFSNLLEIEKTRVYFWTARAFTVWLIATLFYSPVWTYYLLPVFMILCCIRISEWVWTPYKPEKTE